MDLTQLTALSPVDGRYGSKTESLRPIFSEFGLIRHRVLVEIRWLQALARHEGIREVPALSAHAERVLNEIIDKFSEQDAQPRQPPAKEGRREKAGVLYSEAQAAMAREGWTTAIGKLEEVVGLEPADVAASPRSPILTVSPSPMNRACRSGNCMRRI